MAVPETPPWKDSAALEAELLELKQRYGRLSPQEHARLSQLRLGFDQPMAPGMPVSEPAPAAPAAPPPDFSNPRRKKLRSTFKVR